MNQKFFAVAKLLILTMTLVTFSCQKEFPDAPASYTDLNDNSAASLQDRAAGPDFKKLADTLAFRLKNNCVGYSFIVSYKGQYKTSRSGGQSRRIQDPPTKAMTMYEKYSIASVSKTITAAALLKKLNEVQGGNLNVDVPMWTYLPAHWQMGNNIKTITFRELLTHTSGFRYDLTPNSTKNGDDYQTLKNLVSAGINLYDKTYKYNNRNFALMRLIIPKLANYNIIPVNNFTPGFTIAALETIQATQFANAYKDYCRLTIFNKLGTTATQTIDCVNNDANPGRCYAFPFTNAKGIMQPDLTSVCGAQGWVLNTIQVNDFFTTLQYTQTLVSTKIAALMRAQKLGYDVVDITKDGILYYWKNGIYDFGNPVTASYRSLIIGFNDDIQITMMTDSGINLQNAAITAHEDWHP